MHIPTFVSLFAFISLIQCSVIPAVKRAPNDAALAGSASVQWLDSQSNVRIRNFNVRESGMLVMNSFDGPGNTWTARDTGYIVNNAKTDAVSAISIRPNTPDHVIQIFFTVGGDKTAKSVIYNVAQNRWTEDQNYANFVPKGLIPRAAIAWTNAGADPSIRVYYIAYLGLADQHGDGPPIYVGSLQELASEQGYWKPMRQLKEFRQEAGSFGNSIAAVTWTGSAGRQIRLYYYGGMSSMDEYSWTGQSWAATKSWTFPFNENPYRMPLTAVEWTGPSNSHQVRVYRHLARTTAKNVIREFGYDGGNQRWSEGDLPQPLITDTNGDAQISSVTWLKPDASNVHIRLYQYRKRNNVAATSEGSFDSPTGWVADTAAF